MEKPQELPESSHIRDVVFVFDLDVITLLSRKSIEKLKSDHPCVGRFGSLIEHCLHQMGLKQSNDDDEVTNLEGIKECKFQELRTTYEGGLEDLREKRFERFRPDDEFLVCRYKKFYNVLELINRKNKESLGKKYSIVAITEDGVAHGAFQLMTSTLATEFKLDNIYSIATKTFESILNAIRITFGRETDIGIITAEQKYMKEAERIGSVAWEINTNDHIDDFLNHLNGYFDSDEEKRRRKVVASAIPAVRKQPFFKVSKLETSKKTREKREKEAYRGGPKSRVQQNKPFGNWRERSDSSSEEP